MRASRVFSRRVPSILLLVLLVVILGFAGCGGNGNDGSDGSNGPAESDIAVRTTIKAGKITLHSVGTTPGLPAPIVRNVISATRRYVKSAVLAPLRGQPIDKKFSRMFGPTIRSRTRPGTPDYGALTDVGVAGASRTPMITTSPVSLDALLGSDGTASLVAATFTMRIRTDVDDAPLSIRRKSELTFFHDMKGKWLITAYRVSVRRSGPGLGSSETSSVATGNAP